MTKIINLFGAPGSGKSTLASGLFYHMKLSGIKCELVSEWIKSKLYEGTEYPFKDQLYTFSKQNKQIRQLVGKVDYIICDSPLLLSLIYKSREPKIFDDTVLAYFKLYDNKNFLLRRDFEYQQFGRRETETQSDIVQQRIEDMLNRNKIQFKILSSVNGLSEAKLELGI